MKRISILALAVTHQVALAGGVSSGGGEYVTHQLNPWFIGKPAATYCIEHDEKYSQPKTEAEAAVVKALEAWTTALPKFSMHRSFTLPDGEQKTLTLRFNRVPKCSEDTDLRIYLGALPGEVMREVGDRKDGYVGMSRKTSYAKETGWSRGFIWIMPDLAKDSASAGKAVWSKDPYATYLVALHELGHVFGFHHDRGSFMEADFPQSVAESIAIGWKWHDAGYISPEIFLPHSHGSTGGRVCDRSFKLGFPSAEFVSKSRLRLIQRLFSLSEEETKALGPGFNTKICVDTGLELNHAVSLYRRTKEGGEELIRKLEGLNWTGSVSGGPNEGVFGRYPSNTDASSLHSHVFIHFPKFWSIRTVQKDSFGNQQFSLEVRSQGNVVMGSFTAGNEHITLDFSPKWD